MRQNISIDLYEGKHQHPRNNLSSVVTVVQTQMLFILPKRSTRCTVQSFAANDMDTAHDPLHEVGDVLMAIPELAKKENADSEKLASIQKAVDTLMDAFGRVDKTMHGQEGSTYAEESATIDAAVLELESLLNPSVAPKPGAATSDKPASATSETPAAETTSPAEAPAAANPN